MPKFKCVDVDEKARNESVAAIVDYAAAPPMAFLSLIFPDTFAYGLPKKVGVGSLYQEGSESA